MSTVKSHLSQAALNALWRCQAGNPEAWVSRADFQDELFKDEWVIRNPHRLSRLDSTLAGLAREGYLAISGDLLRINKNEATT